MANAVLFEVWRSFNHRFASNLTARERLLAVMRQAGKHLTATPNKVSQWSASAPLTGHEQVAALVVHDLFAGSLVLIQADDGRVDIGNKVTPPGEIREWLLMNGVPVEGVVIDHIGRDALFRKVKDHRTDLPGRYERFAAQCHVVMALLSR